MDDTPVNLQCRNSLAEFCKMFFQKWTTLPDLLPKDWPHL